MPKVNEKLRLCFLSSMDGLCNFNGKREGTFSGPPLYEGPASDTINTIAESIFGRDKLNYTVTLKNSIGTLNHTTGMYEEDSCLYSMQMNQSDIGFAMSGHPLQAKHLQAYPPYFSDNTYLFSHYNASIDVKPADFVQALGDIFSLDVWICFITFTFTFWLIVKLYVKYITHGAMRDDALYEVLTHLFQVETIDYQGPSMRVTSLFVTLLSFYIIGYFTMSMKTDIVVVPDPFVARSYDDLLSRNRIRLVFVKLIDTSDRFEFAEPGSKENRLWVKSLDDLGSRSAMFFQVAGDHLVGMLRWMKDLLLDPKFVPVSPVSELYVKTAWRLGCLVKIYYLRKFQLESEHKRKVLMGMHYWTSRDPNSKEYTMSMVHSAAYKSPYLEKIHRRTSWAFALGAVLMASRNLDRPVEGLWKMENREEGNVFRSCLAKNYRDNLPLVKFAPFALEQFNTLSYLYGLLIALAFICMAGEKTRKWLSTQRAAIKKRGKIRRMGQRAVHLRSRVLSRPVYPNPLVVLATRPITSLH